MRKQKKSEPPDLPDGWYFCRLWVNLRGGHHHREWIVARIEGNRVRLFGSRHSIPLNAPVLENALWHGPIESPPLEVTSRTALALERPAIRHESERGDTRVADKAQVVAEGIVDAFLSTVNTLRVYYDQHPDHRTELVQKIADVIERAFDGRSAAEET